MEKLILPGDTRFLLPSEHRNELVPISETTGIILSGGYGARLKEMTGGKIPKTLLPLSREKPLITAPITALRNAGVKNIVIVTNEIHQDAVASFTNSRPVFDGISYLAEEADPGNTIAAINLAISDQKITKPVIKLNGDEIFEDIDLAEVYSAHVINGYPISVVLSANPLRSDKYSIETCGDRISAAHHTSQKDSGLYLTGTWVIDPSQFGLLAQSANHFEFLQQAIKRNLIFGHVNNSRFYNVNTPVDLAHASNV